MDKVDETIAETVGLMIGRDAEGRRFWWLNVPIGSPDDVAAAVTAALAAEARLVGSRPNLDAVLAPEDSNARRLPS